MADVILHHYPQSPVSEKVRVVLGMKGLDWRSVEIPRLPPKPDLMPLTGGYRLTPVMQVGADVYCDSQCIVRELERRFPEPTLFPNESGGIPWGVGRWTDGPLFLSAIAVIFGDAADAMPEAFIADRMPLYFGPEVDVQTLKAALPESLVRLRAQLGWIESRLEGNRDYILGAGPALPDALCYYLMWLVRGRYSKGPEFLSQFPRICAWEERVKAIGHGNPTEMSAGEALDVAQAGTPETAEAVDPGDPRGFAAGQAVAVIPDDGSTGVEGRLLSLDAQEVVLSREDGRVGQVAVHFPQMGYRVVAR